MKICIILKRGHHLQRDGKTGSLELRAYVEEKGGPAEFTAVITWEFKIDRSNDLRVEDIKVREI